MTAPQDTTSAAWDAHAEDYAREFAPLTGYMARGLFRLVEPRLPPGATVLDIACGPGSLTLAAAEHVTREHRHGGPRGTVLARDASAHMVAMTRQAADAAGVAAVVDCEVGDGQQLDIPDGSVDAACSSFGIFLFPDRLAGWREAARVLRPGGVFATLMWRSAEANETAWIHEEVIFGALPEQVKERLAAGPSRAHLFDAHGLVEEVCRAGGFVNPEVHEIQATQVVPDPHRLWRALRSNPPTAAMFDGCTAEELDHVGRRVVEALEARAGGPKRPVVLRAAAHALVAERPVG